MHVCRRSSCEKRDSELTMTPILVTPAPMIAGIDSSNEFVVWVAVAVAEHSAYSDAVPPWGRRTGR